MAGIVSGAASCELMSSAAGVKQTGQWEGARLSTLVFKLGTRRSNT